LLSQYVYKLLSTRLRNICREIDTVRVKGSKQDIQIYTVDLDTELPIQPDKFEGLSMKKRRQMLQLEKKHVMEKVLAGARQTFQVVFGDKDFSMMRVFVD